MILVGLYIEYQYYCNETKMDDIFRLDPRLNNDSCWSVDLSLSKLLLVNNSLFPWVILVPRKNNLKEIIDLNEEERIMLMSEISLVSKIMQQVFSPDKLNIAALGNIVEQLHIHIIARYQNDQAWPNPVFGKGKLEYTKLKQQQIIEQFQEILDAR